MYSYTVHFLTFEQIEELKKKTKSCINPFSDHKYFSLNFKVGVSMLTTENALSDFKCLNTNV